eukprot:765678-Hanusia_phi.AAC.4
MNVALRHVRSPHRLHDRTLDTLQQMARRVLEVYREIRPNRQQENAHSNEKEESEETETSSHDGSTKVIVVNETFDVERSVAGNGKDEKRQEERRGEERRGEERRGEERSGVVTRESRREEKRRGEERREEKVLKRRIDQEEQRPWSSLLPGSVSPWRGRSLRGQSCSFP